jgi:hypothetical protein
VKKFDMSGDFIVGDGCNVTVYERPDSSRYALDRRGGGSEWGSGKRIFGRARFDSRALSSGRWEGSRSTRSEELPADPPRGRRRKGSRIS